jgi:hypothetical protein
VTGIGPMRAARIIAGWAEQKVIREIMLFLLGAGSGAAIGAAAAGGHGAALGAAVGGAVGAVGGLITTPPRYRY